MWVLGIELRSLSLHGKFRYAQNHLVIPQLKFLNMSFCLNSEVLKVYLTDLKLHFSNFFESSSLM